MDIKLNYIECGTGMPFILLHGNGEDTTYFTHQIKYFSKNYRVITIDTRGHGKSERGNKPFTIKQFAEDLKAFLDEKGINKVILLGFSDGGNIALTFTLKYQHYVERLILNGANLTPKGVKWQIQIPIILLYQLVCLFSKIGKSAISVKELLGLMVNQPMIDGNSLKKVTVPTLVIAGSHDMIKQKHTELIAEQLGNGQLCIIEGDHFIAKKKYKEYNKKVEDFLFRKS